MTPTPPPRGPTPPSHAGPRPLARPGRAAPDAFRELLAEQRARATRPGARPGTPEGAPPFPAEGSPVAVPLRGDAPAAPSARSGPTHARDGELAAMVDRHVASLQVGRGRDHGHVARLVLERAGAPVAVRLALDADQLAVTVEGDGGGAFEPHLRRALVEAGHGDAVLTFER